jgi:predicted phage terminase large subunit-like protein
MIRPDRPTGDKVTRAEPFADQVFSGNVICLNRGWTRSYLQELKAFPKGRLRDQVDASSGAFSKLHSMGQGVVMMA